MPLSNDFPLYDPYKKPAHGKKSLYPGVPPFHAPSFLPYWAPYWKGAPSATKLKRVACWLGAGDKVAWVWGASWDKALLYVVKPMEQMLFDHKVKVTGTGEVVVMPPAVFPPSGTFAPAGELKFVQSVTGIHGCPDRIVVPGPTIALKIARDKTRQALIKQPPDRRLAFLKRDPEQVIS